MGPVQYAMATFVCERCHYTTTVKCNLVAHLRKNKTCPCSFSARSVGDLLHELTHRDDSNMAFSCPYCSKRFKCSSGLCHHKARCTKRNDPQPVGPTNTDTSSSQVVTVCDNTANTINVVTGSQNTIVIHNHFVLRPFGHESRDYAAEATMTRLLPRTKKAVLDIILLKHFNADYPENHNIMCTNLKSPCVDVWTRAQSWEKLLKTKVYAELIEDAQNDLHSHYDRIQSTMSGIPLSRVREVKAFGREMEAGIIKVRRSQLDSLLYNATHELNKRARK